MMFTSIQLRVDQLKVNIFSLLRAALGLSIEVMQEFLRTKSEPISGKKADLIDRVSTWLDSH